MKDTKQEWENVCPPLKGLLEAGNQQIFIPPGLFDDPDVFITYEEMEVINPVIMRELRNKKGV